MPFDPILKQAIDNVTTSQNNNILPVINKIDAIAVSSAPAAGSLAALINSAISNASTAASNASNANTSATNAYNNTVSLLSRLGGGTLNLFNAVSSTAAVTVCNITGSGLLLTITPFTERFSTNVLPQITVVVDGSTVINNLTIGGANGYDSSSFPVVAFIKFASSLSITLNNTQTGCGVVVSAITGV